MRLLPFRAELGRFWRSRVSGGLIVLSLYASALCLPERGSVAGTAARFPTCLASMGRSCFRCGGGLGDAMVWRETDGRLRVAGDYEYAAARIERLPPTLRDSAQQVMVRSYSGSGRALWAPTRRTTSHTIWFFPHGGSGAIPAGEEGEYRAAAFDFLTCDLEYGGAPLPSSLRTSDLRSVELLWSGVLANTWALMLGSALVAWYRPVHRLRQMRASEDAVMRRLRGLCPWCGYSREGLRVARCPECGGELDAVAAG